MFGKIFKIILILGLVLALFIMPLIFLKKPSHVRNWEVGQEKLPKIKIIGDYIEISNFRNFDWKDDGEVEKIYVTETFRMSELEGVNVMISHFSDFEGLAHIFLSFGFLDGRHVVVSMETRREAGEEFSPVLGLMRNFEIIYVVGSEKDIVGLRTNVREERVYNYPTIATPVKTRELFLKIAEDINGIYESPRFYNTIFSNCTNVITRRVEDISDLKFPLTHKTLMPGYFDEVLHKMKIIPAENNFRETKECYRIDNSKVDYNSEEFSNQIRKSCKGYFNRY